MKNLFFIMIIVIISIFPKTNYAIIDKSLLNSDTTHHKLKIAEAYGDFGIGAGFIKGLRLGVGGNLICSNNWGVSLSYYNEKSKAAELPSDYSEGSILGNNQYGIDKINSYSINIIKKFYGVKKNVWGGLEVGGSYIEYQRAHFTPTLYNFYNNFDSNYDINYSKIKTTGLSVRAKLGFTFTEKFGIEIDLATNANKYNTFVGLEFKAIFGLIK